VHGLIRPSNPVEPALQPVLVVLHQEMSTPGRVGHHLQGRGYRLDIRRPALGDPLPATLADHAAIVVFGGPMSANDETDFIRREIDWLSVPLREQKPFLGICLGAQMLARHLVWARGLRGVALARLPMAPGGLRSAGRRQTVGGGRHLRGPGLPVWPGHLRGPVSCRSDARHDVPVDDARAYQNGIAGRAPARGALRRPAGLRPGDTPLAGGLSRSLDWSGCHRLKAKRDTRPWAARL
jgi:hypothetical protein